MTGKEAEFYSAAEMGDLAALVKFFIERGADVNLRNNRGDTALGIAVSQPRAGAAIAKFLMEHGAVFSKLTKGENPLHSAELKGFP